VNEGGIVTKPPASIDVKVGELPSCNRQLVLIVHAQYGCEELDVWKHAAQAIENADIENADSVSCLSKPGIGASPSTAFDGEWQ
jgi:hypothetical protein